VTITLDNPAIVLDSGKDRTVLMGTVDASTSTLPVNVLFAVPISQTAPDDGLASQRPRDFNDVPAGGTFSGDLLNVFVFSTTSPSSGTFTYFVQAYHLFDQTYTFLGESAPATLTYSNVLPEPSSVAALFGGIAAFGLRKRRRR
jgi:hypothetical protein